MEQRRLRLGDILDDYCPRERRLTNHAVVAMVEEDVKQTRCTTCDAEHVYKGGKVPKRKKKDSPAALYKEVLAGISDEAAPLLAAGLSPEADAGDAGPVAAAAVPVVPPAGSDIPAIAAADAVAPAAAPVDRDDADENDSIAVEDGPVHRPLIRAQLPRIEGFKEERRLPEFTIRQSPHGNGGSVRGGDARMKPHAGGAGGNGGNNHRQHGAPRFGGPRPAGPGRSQPGRSGSGPGGGFRGAGQPRPGGPRKRSR